MTLERALEITLIRRDELPRIDKGNLRDVAENEALYAEKFWYDDKSREKADAYFRILEELEKR